MRKRQVNFYIGALLITIVGSLAAVAIIRTAEKADVYGHGDAYYAPAGLTAEALR